MSTVHRLCLLALAAILLTACMDDPPNVVQVADEDVEMNTAMDEARSTVPVFLQALPQAPADVACLVKMPFKGDDGDEHIWVNSVKHRDGRFYGYLANEPHQVTGMAIGDPVDCAVEEISDWVIMHQEEGVLAGGFTIKVMLARQGDAAEGASP
jgi:uncharacterized protein YegJ (DUF2314 family)